MKYENSTAKGLSCKPVLSRAISKACENLMNNERSRRSKVYVLTSCKLEDLWETCFLVLSTCLWKTFSRSYVFHSSPVSFLSTISFQTFTFCEYLHFVELWNLFENLSSLYYLHLLLPSNWMMAVLKMGPFRTYFSVSVCIVLWRWRQTAMASLHGNHSGMIVTPFLLLASAIGGIRWCTKG